MQELVLYKDPLFLTYLLIIIELAAFAWLIIDMHKSKKKQDLIIELEKQILEVEHKILDVEERIIKLEENIMQEIKKISKALTQKNS